MSRMKQVTSHQLNPLLFSHTSVATLRFPFLPAFTFSSLSCKHKKHVISFGVCCSLVYHFFSFFLFALLLWKIKSMLFCPLPVLIKSFPYQLKTWLWDFRRLATSKTHCFYSENFSYTHCFYHCYYEKGSHAFLSSSWDIPNSLMLVELWICSIFLTL